ncbi:hypothetical protein J2853_002005 [Streptosporangium lutulentum]|uniref:Uncharacterized protein n=1 Tax=Streptosporangium lutulentum TaxID=1461250 RepID=A0ABT9Q9N3_9ACTN|nr:hypothetical protein [Streptosporangium lutulentum]
MTGEDRIECHEATGKPLSCDDSGRIPMDRQRGEAGACGGPVARTCRSTPSIGPGRARWSMIFDRFPQLETHNVRCLRHGADGR